MVRLKASMRLVHRDERGISAIVAAVALIGLFGAGMLSIDAGQLWSNRRNLITATDSAALREAELIGFNGGTTCTGAYDALLVANSGDEVFSKSCTVFPGVNDTGYVTVEARKPSDVRLGGVVGIGDQQVYSLSAAQFGYVTEGKGLRPMGICVDNHHIQEWLALQNGTLTQADYDALEGSGVDHPAYADAGVVHRIVFTKDSPDHCGNEAPGNWGWMDFDAGSNSNAALVGWIKDGYPELVGIGDCFADNTNEPCEGETGSSGGSVSSALQWLVDNEIIFHVPIYSHVCCPGANAEFEMWGFLGVKLMGFKVTGAESSRYFDFEFQEAILEGTCCAATGPKTGSIGIRLCAVDHDSQLLETRCTVI